MISTTMTSPISSSYLSSYSSSYPSSFGSISIDPEDIPQLLFSDLIFSNPDAFKLARSYQILSALSVITEDQEFLREWINIYHDLFDILSIVDAGGKLRNFAYFAEYIERIIRNHQRKLEQLEQLEQSKSSLTLNESDKYFMDTNLTETAAKIWI